MDEKIPFINDDKELFREEFVCIMENRFIAGEDDFDYSLVDNNDN